MKKKFMPIIALVMALFAVVVSVGISIAWLVNYQIIDSTGYQIINIDSTINFYQGKDAQGNYNAAPDSLTYYDRTNQYYDCTNADTDKWAWITYPASYYEETYAFDRKSSKIMLSQLMSESTLDTVTIKDMAPSRIVTFKYEITNYASSKMVLSCTIAQLTKTYNLQVRMWEVAHKDDTYTLLNTTEYEEGWMDLSTTGDTTDTTLIANDDDTNKITLESVNSNNANNDYGNRIDLWLQVRMKPEADNENMIASAVELEINLGLTAQNSSSES